MRSLVILQLPLLLLLPNVMMMSSYRVEGGAETGSDSSILVAPSVGRPIQAQNAGPAPQNEDSPIHNMYLASTTSAAQSPACREIKALDQ